MIEKRQYQNITVTEWPLFYSIADMGWILDRTSAETHFHGHKPEVGKVNPNQLTAPDRSDIIALISRLRI
jgi:hypothetical protein